MFAVSGWDGYSLLNLNKMEKYSCTRAILNKRKADIREERVERK